MHPLGSRSVPVEVSGSTEQDKRPALLFETSENYAQTMGIPLVEGRFLTAQEVNAAYEEAERELELMRQEGEAEELAAE